MGVGTEVEMADLLRLEVTPLVHVAVRVLDIMQSQTVWEDALLRVVVTDVLQEAGFQ